MNPTNLSPEWQKTIRELIQIAGKLDHGEIKIVVHEKKATICEYTVKRKTESVTPFEIKLLDD